MTGEQGARLKKLRDFLGYSQRDLAEEFQVTSGAIAHWESGLRPIPGPIEKLMSIYEDSLKLSVESDSLISEEALQISRELFALTTKTLRSEGFVLVEESERNLSQFVQKMLSDYFKRDRMSGKIKAALARQLIKSLEGSRGLSIKAAQLASFLELGLPQEIPTMLGDLQLSCKPLAFSQIQEILNEAYGNTDEYFVKISTTPLAVTSLAQLHRAKLVTGEEVVIKIQHPEVQRILLNQFKKLSFISFLGNVLGNAAQIVLEEIQYQVFQELDYEREVLNQEKFRNIFEHNSRIVIPQIYRSLCRKNIIVSAYESGISFPAFVGRANETEKNKAAMLIAYFHTFAVFKRGLLHGDAHPGNFLFRKDQVIFLDFGRIIDVQDDEIQREFRLYTSIFKKDKDQVIKELKDRRFADDPNTFDFDEFWRVLQTQERHHLTDAPFRITRDYLRSMQVEARNFKDRRKIRMDKILMRSILVNASLLSLFAELNAEVHWRKQALEILNGP